MTNSHFLSLLFWPQITFILVTTILILILIIYIVTFKNIVEGNKVMVKSRLPRVYLGGFVR